MFKGVTTHNMYSRGVVDGLQADHICKCGVARGETPTPHDMHVCRRQHLISQRRATASLIFTVSNTTVSRSVLPRAPPSMQRCLLKCCLLKCSAPRCRMVHRPRRA